MTEGFAAVPNWMYRDSTLSSYAIMVYGALASHSGKGGIFPSQMVLATEARCSERKVRDALAELQTAGAIVRVRRSTNSGRLADGYELRPNGLDQQPAPDAGSGLQPAHGAAATGTDVQLAPLIEEEPLKKVGVSEMFDEFWVAYPRHVAKAAAKAKFEKLAKTVSAKTIVEGARRFAQDPNLPEPQFIPHPTTWLTQGRWDDDALPARDRPVDRRDVDDVDDWLRR